MPPDAFRKFLKPYENFISSLDITLADEDIKVEELWAMKKLFKVDMPLTVDFVEKNDAIKKEFTSTIHIERINRFPHRMINIRHIQKEGKNLSYYLNLQTSDDEVRAVEMNGGARLYDYLNAFDMHKEGSINFDSIQKKVFKPDSRYRNLLVPCLPHTFCKGRNMQSDLDYCLEWYILSPFDYKSAKILSKSIPNGVDSLQILIESVLNGAQFKKCVSYIMKKRHIAPSDKETAEESIKKEYIEFVTGFYGLLANYQSQKKSSEEI